VAIEFQNLEVTLGALNTDADPASLPPGTLTVCSNVSSEEPGCYVKRFGYGAVSAPAAPLPSVRRLLARDTELVAVDNAAGLWSFLTLSSGPTWTKRAEPVPQPTASAKSVYVERSSAATSPAEPTVAYANGVICHAFISGVKARVSLELTADGTIALENYDVGVAGVDYVQIRAVAAGNYIVVIFASIASQRIDALSINTATLATVGPSAIFSGISVSAGTPSLAACELSATDIVIAWQSATPSIGTARITASTLAVAANSAPAIEACAGMLSVVATVGEYGFLSYVNGANWRGCFFNPSTMVQTVAPFTIAAGGAGAQSRVTAIRTSSTTLIPLIDTAPVAATTQAFVRFTTVTTAAAVGAIRTIFNARLISEGWAYSGRWFVNLYYQTIFGAVRQNTYFTVELSTVTTAPFSEVMAMHAYRTAGDNNANLPNLSRVAALSADEFRFDETPSFKLIGMPNTIFSISSYGINFADHKAYQSVQIGQSAFIGGGVVSEYDGFHLTEANFLLAPAIISATPGAVGAGGMDNGTYSYIAIYESVDIHGNTIRSSMSAPVSATTTAGAGLGKVTLIFEQLEMTRLGSTGRRSGVIAVYRTKASGSTYFYVGSGASTGSVAIDVSVGTATYTDFVNDSLIGVNNNLYTTGNALEREPPPPAIVMVVHRNRVWGISSADPRVVFYSGEYVSGESVWFSTAQQFRMDVGGDCTALASLDDKLVIFKADRIFIVTGEPPNQLGQGASLTSPQLVSADCGCSDHRTVCNIPSGVMFNSAKGMHLLSRSLETVFMGEPSAYVASSPNNAAAEIMSAVMVPDVREVRFEMLQSPPGYDQKLVYNYRDNRWMTHSNITGRTPVGGVVANGHYYCARSTGAVYLESRSDYLDAGAFVPSALTLAPISPAGKQGLARVQRCNVLLDVFADIVGAPASSYALDLSIYLNYGATLNHRLFTGAEVDAARTDFRKQLSFHLQYQVGEGFEIAMFDAVGTALGNGRGATWRGVTLVAGVKRGSFEKSMAPEAKA